MIGFIKNLFSSILSFFVGLFGGKKSLENKPSTTSASAEKLAADTVKTGNKILSSFTGLLGDKKSQENKPSLTSAATAKTRKSSGYFMELEETEEMKPGEANQSANGAAAKTPQPAAAAKTTDEEKPVKTPQPVAAKSAKDESTQTPEATATAQSAKVELVQTAKGVKAVPAESKKVPGVSANGQTQTETTFAPKYLAPTATSNSRRRPGPSMNSFLDMARQFKTPAK